MIINLLNGTSFPNRESGLYTMDASLGTGTIIRTKTTQGIEILVVRANFKEPLYVTTTIADDYFSCRYYLVGGTLDGTPSVFAQLWQKGAHHLGKLVENHLPQHIYEGSVELIEVRYPIAIIEHFLGDGEQAIVLRKKIQQGEFTRFTNSAKIQPYAYALIEMNYESISYAMQVEAQAIALLATCFDALLATPSLPSKDELIRIKKAYDLLLENIEQPLTMEELAQQTGFTERELNAFFTEAFGASIMTLLRAWRVAASVEKLANNQLTLREVAMLFGYNQTDGVITKAFKQQFGMTPHAYFKLWVTGQ